MKKLIFLAICLFVIFACFDANSKHDNDATQTDQDVTQDTDPGYSSDGSGHEAGYNWANENGVDDESACDTAGDNHNSPSFAEGCKAYVQENEPSDNDENN
jgi:hypothetical protein